MVDYDKVGLLAMREKPHSPLPEKARYDVD